MKRPCKKCGEIIDFYKNLSKEQINYCKKSKNPEMLTRCENCKTENVTKKHNEP